MPHDYLYRRHRSSRLAAQSWAQPTTTPGLPEEPVTTPGTPQFPSRARGPRRAAAVAYLILSTFVTPDVTVPLDKQVFPNRAIAAPRAANTAYWIDNRVTPPEVIGEELQKQILPDRTAAAPRTAKKIPFESF